jgi:adenosylcobinamide kinase / adenosylcobinamide-phosphate guanylyltransferase
VKELILGGVRSGKSLLAEQRARASGHQVVYIATAIPAGDAELLERVRQHRLRRPATWIVVEEPLVLGAALRTHASAGRCIIVECLTLWLTNLLCTAADRFEFERHSLLETLPALAGDVILVSNETGLGVVPLGALPRRFVDATGELHQSLAAMCDRVTVALAGLPLLLKDCPT